MTMKGVPASPGVPFAHAVALDSTDSPVTAQARLPTATAEPLLLCASAVITSPIPTPSAAPQHAVASQALPLSSVQPSYPTHAVIPPPSSSPPAPATLPTTHHHATNHHPKPNSDDFGPLGRWQQKLCACFCCRPLCWMSLCCTPCIYGQLMQRLGLAWHGQPDAVGYGRSPCKTVTAIALAFVLLMVVLDMLFHTSLNSGIALLFSIYFWIAFTSTRWAMKRRFQIPAQYCSNCYNGGMVEDCCVSCWRSCCSAVQMARHTHNGDWYPYQADSLTGLSSYAPALTAAVPVWYT